MRNYRLSGDARQDIKKIADYSLENFGRDRAVRYRESLFSAIERLAQYPQIGSDFSHVQPGYRRLAHESHVIYYRITDPGIFVQRVLHAAQDPARHL